MSVLIATGVLAAYLFSLLITFIGGEALRAEFQAAWAAAGRPRRAVPGHPGGRLGVVTFLAWHCFGGAAAITLCHSVQCFTEQVISGFDSAAPVVGDSAYRQPARLLVQTLPLCPIVM
jgi:hypothetical protein